MVDPFVSQLIPRSAARTNSLPGHHWLSVLFVMYYFYHFRLRRHIPDQRPVLQALAAVMSICVVFLCFFLQSL